MAALLQDSIITDMSNRTICADYLKSYQIVQKGGMFDSFGNQESL